MPSLQSEFIWGLLGAVIGLSSIVVTALIGLSEIQKKPLVAFFVGGGVLSGFLLIVFAVVATLNINRSIIGESQRGDEELLSEEIRLTEVSLSMTQSAIEEYFLQATSGPEISIPSKDQNSDTNLSETETVNQPRAIRQERVELGPYEYDVFSRELAEDELIVGDAVDVEGRGLFCVVFWFKGPGVITFSMLNGAWDRYSGVQADEQMQEFINVRFDFLQNQHSYCKNVNVPIVELGTN